ncbi:hypothetical protein [Anaeromyxobacter dehalogenans]|uniref:Uncharacterized protein n=1 Tax=Anaeromyxobacter dehalogenans (strain 2CP-C) TaxID=290397 RepID=Q2ILW3_ANADE|nr:hypothetical protein [Anaeromyxobacter dehalogenans]ABC79797.1 hypothetical protein Adeh_0019 [Anaeromyxobacter dehalogenans 2CP-C]
MSTKTVACSLAFGVLLATPGRTAGQCTSADVPAGGIFTKLDAQGLYSDLFSLTLVNLSDAALEGAADINATMAKYSVAYAPGMVRWDCADPPFYKLCSDAELNPNTCQDVTQGFRPAPFTVRVERNDSAIWRGGWANDCYDGKIDFTWRTSTFQVKFKRQKVYGGALAYPHYGTWTTLLPRTGSWCAPGTFCSGVWTTPHDYEMRNITTIAANELVVSLYSTDNQNLVVVLRETHWDGAQGDAYDGKRLDWVDNDSPRVPGDCNH